MNRLALAVVLLLAACGRPSSAPVADTPGGRLEEAAVRLGLVIDPGTVKLAGSWARDADRLCVVGAEDAEQRIGVVVEYGEGQGCSGAGTVRRASDRLRVAFGAACRFAARFEGDRIVFPAEVPSGCAALCTGRATLAAMTTERLSGSESEARTLRGRDGKALCAS